MRAGVWLVIALGPWCQVAGCSGGYPLPPTPCDELCHVTQGIGCSEDYQPAACVLSCEQGKLYAEDCRPYFDAQLACFRENPGAIKNRCHFYPPGELGRCEPESEAFQRCLQARHSSSGFEP